MSRQSERYLVVVGSVAFDTIKTPFGSTRRALGGSAVYFSAAARFFCPTHIVGIVGKDFSQKYFHLLKGLRINTNGIEVKHGKTFHWKGYYEKDLNQAFTQKTDLNVFLEFRPELNSFQQKAPYLFLANIDPKLQLYVLKQAKNARWVACDTMNFWIESAKKDLMNVLRKVDISLMNEAEIRQLTGEAHLLKAVKQVMRLGPSVVVVKRGEYGAMCFTKQGHFSLPAYLLDSLKDPTGAGDSFAGGFLGFLTKMNRLDLKSIQKCAVYGSLIASFNVQSFSIDKLSKISSKDISTRLREYKRTLISTV